VGHCCSSSGLRASCACRDRATCIYHNQYVFRELVVCRRFSGLIRDGTPALLTGYRTWYRIRRRRRPQGAARSWRPGPVREEVGADLVKVSVYHRPTSRGWHPECACRSGSQTAAMPYPLRDIMAATCLLKAGTTRSWHPCAVSTSLRSVEAAIADPSVRPVRPKVVLVKR
jgi:hypothetical protein